MNKRIFEVRQSAALSMRAFGERIGISGPSVARLESGENNPSEQTIRAICSEFSVNRDWLVDGVGERDISRPFVPELMRVLNQHPALKALLESMVDQMDQDDWHALNVIANKLAEKKQEKDG